MWLLSNAVLPAVTQRLYLPEEKALNLLHLLLLLHVVTLELLDGHFFYQLFSAFDTVSAFPLTIHSSLLTYTERNTYLNYK